MVKGGVTGLKMILLGVLFALTTPLGIGIGLGISDSYNANDKTYLAFDGIINSVASGILLYNGIVDLLLPCFSEKGFATTSLGKSVGFFALFLGAGAMALIAKWA